MKADATIIRFGVAGNGDGASWPVVSAEIKGTDAIIKFSLALARSKEIGLQELAVESLTSLLLYLSAARRQEVVAQLAGEDLGEILEEILFETLGGEVTPSTFSTVVAAQRG